jgi:hypothetical protein
VLTSGQFAALRSAYMNANIRPGAESLAVAVLVDQALVGVFAYSWAPTLGNWAYHLPQQPTVYMLSDFPVSTSRYTKLSKLVPVQGGATAGVAARPPQIPVHRHHRVHAAARVDEVPGRAAPAQARREHGSAG